MNVKYVCMYNTTKYVLYLHTYKLLITANESFHTTQLLSSSVTHARRWNTFSKLVQHHFLGANIDRRQG